MDICTKLAVLPGLETFVDFAFVFGLVLVPAGALMAQPSYTTLLFTPVAAFFCRFLAPTNLMNYDTQQFYNAALASLTGHAVISFAAAVPAQVHTLIIFTHPTIGL